MINVEIGKMEESQVMEFIGDYANYYNEGSYDWYIKELNLLEATCPSPCIEVFCYYGKEIVEHHYRKLANLLENGVHGHTIAVDYEHFGKQNFSRIMVYINQTTPLYQAISIAQVLSEYGISKIFDMD